MSVVESKEIALLGKASRALSEAKSLDEVLSIRDQAAAAKHYCRVAKLGTETYNLAAEIKVRAERKAGEFLAVAEKHNGDPRLRDVTRLSELGIEKIQSHRWQKIASVPEKEFEKHIESTKASNRELTTAGVIRLAKERQHGKDSKARMKVAKSNGVVSDLSQLVSVGSKFGTIYADPPWSYSNSGTRSNVKGVYAKTMTVDQICAEPVAQLAADKSHLHLWTTNAFLFEAKRVMEAWGFEYKSCFVWVKPQMGIGNYWRVSHEFMLLGVRGGLTFLDRGQKSWLQADRTKHSVKPHEVRRIIEKTSPGPYLEMYGRHRLEEHWTVYGNEIESEGLF